MNIDSQQGLLFGDAVAVEYNKPLDKPSRVMLQSGNNNWCSPPEVLEPVRKMGPIEFDPFSNEHSIVGADASIALPENSLLIEWPKCRRYCNPPYGEELEACARKIGEEAERGGETWTLVPARTDTAWWQVHLRVRICCAWRGRIRFLEPVDVLMARHAERVARAEAAGMRPPPAPKFQMVTETLARGDAATFAAAVVYHGPREDLFRETFATYGEIYRRAA